MSSHPEASCRSTPVSPAVDSGPASVAAPPEPVLEPRHVAQLQAMRLPGKPSLFLELTAIFRKEAPQRMVKLAEAFANQDIKLLSSLAHAMVGSLATLGARRMQLAARSLEQAADRGDWAVISTSYSHLVECRAELEIAFDQYIKEENA